MRMLREAAVVAAVVGGVSMAGAGAASAGGWEPPQPPTITCEQTNGDTSGDTDAGLLDALGSGGGSADARNQQNNCGIGIAGNDQTSGNAEGGAGAGLVDAA